MNKKLNEEVIKNILGITEPVCSDFNSMLKSLVITFFPPSRTTSKETIVFSEKLKVALQVLGANILPYQQTLDSRKRIKKGITVISTDKGEAGNLPIDHVSNPKTNPIVTIAKISSRIDNAASFEHHMNLAIQLFSQHMANIIICFNGDRWMVCSLNGFSPSYKMDSNFNRRVLKALVPKIAAPLKPPLLSEFKISKWDIKAKASFYKPYIDDIVKASRLFKQTALYPPAKAFETLPFRNNFYKKIGKRYLDRRNGMSYGFFARQLPTALTQPIFKLPKNEGKNSNAESYCYRNKLHILFNIMEKRFYLKVPDVWAITTRSGCEKTDLNPDKDLIKLGLVNGQMVMEIPNSKTSLENYRPSFDTKLILAQAVANAIYASILAYFKPKSKFPALLKSKGMALAHWHSYMLPELKPKGWYIYGITNPAVSCSTPHSAIYAFKGKEDFFTKLLLSDRNYLGDIHIEPHHGINVTYHSLTELAENLLLYPKVFELGALKIQVH